MITIDELKKLKVGDLISGKPLLDKGLVGEDGTTDFVVDSLTMDENKEVIGVAVTGYFRGIELGQFTLEIYDLAPKGQVVDICKTGDSKK